MNFRVESLRTMALNSGWVDGNGKLIVDRIPAAYALAKQIGATNADVTEAFAYQPDEVANYIAAMGWEPLRGGISPAVMGAVGLALLLVARGALK